MRTLSLAVLAALALSACSPSRAPKETLLQVSVEEKVSTAPDIATINTGVYTQNKTAALAMSDNAAKMTAVIAALKKAGVAERDIQTAQLNLNPQYVYSKGGKPSISGYEAQNIVTVTVRDLKDIGGAIDALVADGANQVSGITFAVEDVDRAVDSARAAALTKARARADIYANAAGLKVRRIVTIAENSTFAPPMPIAYEARAQAANMSTPVSPGEVKSSVAVNVTYELR